MSEQDYSGTASSVGSFMEKARYHFRVNWNKSAKTNMMLNDFNLIRTIGSGSFGRVSLVREKRTSKYYALKIIEKEQVVKRKQFNHVINEKRVLLAVKFPFIICMDYYFEDNVYLYFALSYASGGELYSLLRKFGKFNENQSRFYAAQILLAFEFLHSLDIVYRDLKPENVLLDDRGYVKVTDLGFCKVLNGQRTYTICGTPEYLAPEVILGKGYGLEVDWWSLGVIVYEMCAGYPPFYSMDKVTLYQTIIDGRFRFVPWFSYSLQTVISGLLETDPIKRLGSPKDGVQGVKVQEWFADTNWLSIVNRTETAPFVPQLSGPEDTKYYETYPEESLKQSPYNTYADDFKDF